MVISLSSNEKDKIKKDCDLVPNHAYAIIDLKELGDYKIIKCMNPWGKNSPLKILESDQIYSKICNKNDLEKGIFWIKWDDVLKYFHMLYINWNPMIYSFSKRIHSKIKIMDWNSKICQDRFCLDSNPQFLLKIMPHNEEIEVGILEADIFFYFILIF
jgi:calpain-7